MKYRSLACTATVIVGLTQGLIGSCGTVAAIPKPSAEVVPFRHSISQFTSNVFLTPSRQQTVSILGLAVDHRVDSAPRVLPLLPDVPRARFDFLFASAVSSSGAMRVLRWHEEKAESGLRWMVIDDYNDLTIGSVLQIGTWSRVEDPDGYFVAFKDGVQTKEGPTNFSGCFRVADGVPYTKQHNNGVTVTEMTNPGDGYRGWCYRYRPVTAAEAGVAGLPNAERVASYFLHYFTASTAPSWEAVASWNKRIFEAAAAHPSHQLARLVDQLGLKQADATDADKIASIRRWMAMNLKYHGGDMFYGEPPVFDSILEAGGSDCKGLSLVLMQLLHAAGLRAQLILTSSKNSHVFQFTAARLGEVNHVAVYLPDRDVFIDPTVADGAGLVGHQAMDVETAKVLIIH